MLTPVLALLLLLSLPTLLLIMASSAPCAFLISAL